jgi:hypothetical protein
LEVTFGEEILGIDFRGIRPNEETKPKMYRIHNELENTP